jgi:hypothetical protein
MDWKDWFVDCRFGQVSMPLVSLGCVHLEESTTYSPILGLGGGGGGGCLGSMQTARGMLQNALARKLASSVKLHQSRVKKGLNGQAMTSTSNVRTEKGVFQECKAH